MLFFRSIFLVFALCPILPTSQSSSVGVEDDDSVGVEDDDSVGVEDDDSDASGYDQGGSGLDSLDLSAEEDLPKRLTTTTQIRIVSQDGEEPRFKFPGDLKIDRIPGYVHPAGFTVETLKTLLRSRDMIAGAIAGAAGGVILALAVVAVLVYKWKVKDGYTLGKNN